MDISARAISLPDRPRTGHLGHHSTDDPEAQPRVAAFESGLRELGWLDGRNLRIECRWVSTAILRSIAAELARMPPDLILATSTPVMAALQEQSLSVFRRNRASLK